MNNAQNTVANNPFAQPVAPVAGFSGLQNQAFGQIGNSANLANPFYQQAGQLYGQSAQQPNVSAFFNPMASAVNAQLQNTFGMQNSQNTGQLTQAAGGVGADRIAVGQANLANQQGLAAGQVNAQLYQQAQQAAQQQQQAQMQAAAGLGNVGQGMQNAALQGGQSLLGAGGLQQQLAQAQLDSPYQQQLAALAFPYQQAQFLSGQVGALAPGLGGTTTGQGTTQSQFNPSIWGQIGGGLQTLGGIGGYLGGSGSKGSGGGNYASQPLTGADAWQNSQLFPGYGTAAQGGVVNPFAAGGSVPDEPIDIEPSMFPDGKIPHIQEHIPQLNLNPPQQQQSGGGGGGGVGLGTLLSIASMFGSGGAVHPNPYAGGGEVDDATRAAGLDMLRNAMTGGGNEPFRMPDQGAVDDWRNGTPLPAANAVPMPQPRPSAGDEAPDDVTASSKLPPVAAPSLAPQGAQADTGPSLAGFLRSPWAALSLGGLEAMRTGSLASGFGQTLKLAQTQREADQKEQEHQDSLTKMTPYQTAQIGIAKQKLEKDTGATGVLGSDARQLIAESYLAGDKSALSGLGYGNVGSQNRAAVWSDISRLAKEQGVSGAGLAAIKTDYAANTAGARTAATRGAGIDIAVEEARRTFPLALAASEAVPREQFVPWNKAVQLVNSNMSSPALARFVTANRAVIAAYAQAMSRTGVPTVHAQQAAEELMSTATSPAAYKAVVSQMEMEMQAAKAAPDSVRQHILDRIGGKTSAAPSGGGPQVGERKQFKQGWGVWNGSTYVPEGAQ